MAPSHRQPVREVRVAVQPLFRPRPGTVRRPVTGQRIHIHGPGSAWDPCFRRCDPSRGASWPPCARHLRHPAATPAHATSVRPRLAPVGHIGRWNGRDRPPSGNSVALHPAGHWPSTVKASVSVEAARGPPSSPQRRGTYAETIRGLPDRRARGGRGGSGNSAGTVRWSHRSRVRRQRRRAPRSDRHGNQQDDGSVADPGDGGRWPLQHPGPRSRPLYGRGRAPGLCQAVDGRRRRQPRQDPQGRCAS